MMAIIIVAAAELVYEVVIASLGLSTIIDSFVICTIVEYIISIGATFMHQTYRTLKLNVA